MVEFRLIIKRSTTVIYIKFSFLKRLIYLCRGFTIPTAIPFAKKYTSILGLRLLIWHISVNSSNIEVV
jgi:hypothetical protein